MDQHDVERIARAALRELGAGVFNLTVTQDTRQADRWQIDVRGGTLLSLSVRAGQGTSPQFIREQIFDQYHR